jgi:putative colanic acid biosynthesis UDP-glucose lipid carrier transferase
MDGIKSAVIVGANQIGSKLADQFISEQHLGVTFLGFFDDRGSDRLGKQLSKLLLGVVDDLSDYIKRTRVDALFIALPMASQPRIIKLLDELKDSTVSIYFIPDIFVTDLIQARVDDIGGIPVVAVRESPFNGFNGLIKRLSDVILASIILVVLTPILLIVALAVKITSPGPVLFKQRRYGLDGQEIFVYKFRSMTVCEDGDVVKQAQKGDSRLTPIGGFIRRTSLDELPQFINVLQGSMSVVGPRPHAVAHNETYRKLIKGYMVRHKVKPGITGLAQVNGCRGETDSIDKMEKRIEYDLEYLRKWSLSLDIEIVLRTISQVLRDGKAY